MLDGFAATVISTPTDLRPDLSIKGRPFRLKGLEVFPDRPIPPYVWYLNKMRYLVYWIQQALLSYLPNATRYIP